MALVCISGSKPCDGCGICFDKSLMCDHCDSKIADYYYEINGSVLCKECLDDIYRVEVD